MQRHTDSNLENSGFIPHFRCAFLHPRYWGIWLGVGFLILFAYLPAAWRSPILNKLGCWIGRLSKSARRRAKINLLYCMPELDEKERETLLDKMFSTALQTFVFFVEIALHDPLYSARKVVWHGEEHLQRARALGRNIILLVPHGWGVDIPAMLLAARGIKMAAMFHHQSNPVSDWLWNKVRRRFGGRLHAREDGIKPFVNSVRAGYVGYYLPDQDFGAEHSEFVSFFATYKATLPIVGRLMNICRADIIPLFPVYNTEKNQLDIFVRPAMSDLMGNSEQYIARRMNEEIEHLITPNPEQYTWILKLLKTRKIGEEEPYLRDDL